MARVRYLGPFDGVDVVTEHDVFHARRGEVVDLPEATAEELVRGPDWTPVEERQSDPLGVLSAAQLEALQAAGLADPDALAAADDAQLLAVPGIGPATLAALREVLDSGTDE